MTKERLYADFRQIRDKLDIHLKELEGVLLEENPIADSCIKALKKAYPALNKKDIQLFAYISQGYDSKDISVSMGVSAGHVRTNKTRLKRKLMVPAEEDLLSFIKNKCEELKKTVVSH